MVIRRKRQLVARGAIKLSNTDIDEVSAASFIGTQIDCHLTWKPHIQLVNKCVRRKVGVLYKLRQYVPQRILVLLYKSFIQPHILYGIEVWGSTYKSHLNCIHISQKKWL